MLDMMKTWLITYLGGECWPTYATVRSSYNTHMQGHSTPICGVLQQIPTLQDTNSRYLLLGTWT